MRTLLAPLLLCGALPSAIASQTHQPDWEAAIADAVLQNSKALQFSLRCRYPQDILAGLGKYDEALLGAVAKAGTPTMAYLNAIKADARARMQTPSSAVCTDFLERMRQLSQEKAVQAHRIHSLTKNAR